MPISLEAPAVRGARGSVLPSPHANDHSPGGGPLSSRLPGKGCGGQRIDDPTANDVFALGLDGARPFGTALVTEDGEVRFFDDIYRADAALARALAEETATRSRGGP
jgi:hypothetical protein